MLSQISFLGLAINPDFLCGLISQIAKNDFYSIQKANNERRSPYSKNKVLKYEHANTAMLPWFPS